MACRLLGAKSLSERILDYCLLSTRHKTQRNFNQNSYISNQEDPFENVVWKMKAILSRPRCGNVKSDPMSWRHHGSFFLSWTCFSFLIPSAAREIGLRVKHLPEATLVSDQANGWVSDWHTFCLLLSPLIHHCRIISLGEKKKNIIWREML